jgi:hypothetical protein
MEEVQTEKKSKSVSFKLVFFILAVLVAAGGYVGSYYFYNKYNQAKITLDNPEVASQKEVQEITTKLGKIYALPEGEEPTVATVLDKEKLKDQAFFAKSENGDKVVIFTKSQIAILFRVTEGKIINVAPVSLQENQEVPINPTPLPQDTEVTQ